jgi:hypothetical protein
MKFILNSVVPAPVSSKHEAAHSQAGAGWDSDRDRKDTSQSGNCVNRAKKCGSFASIERNIFRINTCERELILAIFPALSPFRMNTSESVHSKTT